MAKYTDKEMDRIISEGKKAYASQRRGQPGGMSSISSAAKKAAFQNIERGKSKVQEAIDRGKIPSRGDDDDDDRIAQIYQTATEDQLQRQRKILDSLPKRSGQFANIFQEGSDYKEELDKLGYKVSEDGNSIVDDKGATIAGVNQYGNVFSGSRKVEQILDEYTGEQYKGILTRPGEKTSDEERQEITDKAFEFIEDIGGETSLAQQDKIRRILNRGRGLGVLPTRTGDLRYSAAGGDFGDVLSDAGRALFGGKAETQVAVPKPVYEPERVQGLVPQLFEAAVEGKFSPIAMGLKALEKTYNTVVDGFNKTYDTMNDVQKEIFENKGKYPFAENIPTVRQAEDQSMQLLELQNRMNLLENYKRRQTYEDYKNIALEPSMAAEVEPIVTTAPTEDSRGELPASDVVTEYYVESGQFKKDLERSGILTVDDPETQEPEKSDDQVSFTPFDNPFNLEFANQEGAEPGYGGPEGDRFAKFDSLDQGLKAGVSRIAEIADDKKTTKGFLDVYAPKEDNPNTYDSYLANLENVVGPTIEPDEIEDLSKAIIRQENTRDLADKYLNYLEQEKDKIYSGIVS